MKKRIMAFILSAVTIMALTGCGSGGKEPATTQGNVEQKTEQGASEETTAAAVGKDPKEIKVAGVVFQEDQFMKLMQQGYQAAADDYGVTCMLANVNGDQGKEAELISTYTTQKLDGIAISPLNEETSLQSLKAANDAGLKVSIGNTKLVDAPWVCGGYTSDNYNLGELTGQQAKKFIEEKLDGKARIAIVEFQSQLPEQSTDRKNGFLDQLKDLDIEIVADQDAWMQDAAVQTVSDILTANEATGGIDIIWAANDGGTIGATMAVKNSGKAGKTFVFGTDAAEQQIEMLRSEDNILQCVTGQNPYEIGYNTMEVLIKAIMGEETSGGKEVIVPGICLTREDQAGIDQFEKDLMERIN